MRATLALLCLLGLPLPHATLPPSSDLIFSVAFTCTLVLTFRLFTDGLPFTDRQHANGE